MRLTYHAQAESERIYIKPAQAAPYVAYDAACATVKLSFPTSPC